MSVRTEKILEVVVNMQPGTKQARILVAGGLIITLVSGCASLKDLDLGGLAGNAPLDEATVASGLREALRVGTERTVSATSRTDGYLGNELIRIVLPQELDGMTSTLRDLGLGAVVDDLAVGMNLAAESPAGEAADVFWQAVRQMTIADAFAILDGGDTAATDYFRTRTTAELAARFGPIVEQKMNDVGVFPVYRQLYDRYTRIPLVSKPDLDLPGYVTDQALNGLFTVLAQEETRIRQDPLARTTALLQRVFGH